MLSHQNSVGKICGPLLRIRLKMKKKLEPADLIQQHFKSKYLRRLTKSTDAMKFEN